MELGCSESQAVARLGQGSFVDPGQIDLSRSRAKKYEALGLEHEPEKCPDLRYAYEQQYEISILRGRAVEPYRHLKTAVRRLTSFSVAVDVAEAEVLAEECGLFQLTTSSDMIRAFIGRFQATNEA
jgi:hypothetical protein